MEDYKKLLTDLYKIYDPERVKQIDYFLEKYKGKEKQFYTRQKENYENKKPLSDSQKIIDEALARIKSREKEAANKASTTTPTPTPPAPPTPPAEKINPVTVEKKVEPVSTPMPVEEKEPEKPVYKPDTKTTFESDIKSRTAAEIREERSNQNTFSERKPEPKKHVIPPPAHKIKQEIPSKSNEEKQNFETPPPIQTDIRVKRKYFFNIFGMVVLTIVLFVLIYLTFFAETDNTAKGIVQKPAGMATEKAVNTKSDGTIAEKETTAKTKEIDSKDLATETSAQQPEEATVEPVKTENTITKTPDKETKNSFWSRLFKKEDSKEQQGLETKQAVVEEVEKPIVEEPVLSQKTNKTKTTATETKISLWDRLFKKKEIAEPKTSEKISKPKEEKQIMAVQEPEPAVNKEEKPTEVKTEPVQSIEEQTVEDEAASIEEIKEQPVVTSSSSNALRLTRDAINLPAYFVACYAVKTEDYALVKINQLKSKGFDACYYWIPDFDSQGNRYFKVVIGPFSTSRDAYRKLTPVQERAEFDAYVITLK